MGTVRGTRGRIKAAMRGMRTAMGVDKSGHGWDRKLPWWDKAAIF